jgi:hypothetical protein
MNAPRFDPEFALELSLEEILEDLCWPHPPPGSWSLDAGRRTGLHEGHTREPTSGRPRAAGICRAGANLPGGRRTIRVT